MIKRTLATVLIILTVLPAAVLAGSVLFASSNGFDAFDAAWESSINAALGNGSSSASASSPLPEGERYIVKFKDEIALSAIEGILDGADYRQLAESEHRLFSICDDGGSFVEEHKDIIDYSEPDLVREALSVTNDSVIMPSYEMTGIYEAWDTVKAKSSVIVAVLDTGVDRTHEDLIDASILPGYDAVTKTAGIDGDEVGHGTGIIGIIAATADNGIGIAGAAHGVTVLPIKVSSSSTTIYSSDLVSAIRFAANSGAKIINMSVGGLSYSVAEQEAVNYAVSKGCILISASGNGGELPYADKESYPASYEGVISVASCNENGERSSFSQYNAMVDIAAPGESVVMPIVEGGASAYRIDSGTSYSCALVSAIAALSLSACDEGVRFGGDEFLSLLMNTGNKERTDELGFGIIKAKPIVDAANLPIITGVIDGGVYSESLKIGFNRGKALLDGEDLEDGDAIIANGSHVLKITDGEYEKTISFRLEYEPFSYKFEEFSDYCYFKFDKGFALLDGFPYESGQRITESGRHEFIITDGIETFTKIIDVQYALPSVYGVEDGGYYSTPIEICIVGEGKATLDGKKVHNKVTVAESGVHTLLIESGNGAVKKEYTFEIDFPFAQFTQTDYAQATAAIDKENGYACIYGDSLVGVRIYDINDMSQYLHFLPIGRVYAHKFTETELILAGDDGITVISRANALDPETAIVGNYYLDGISLYTFADETVYCFGNESIYSFDMATDELTHIANLEFTCQSAYYSDGIICLVSDQNDRTAYLFDTESNSLSSISFEKPIDNAPICFQNGYLAIGNSLINVMRQTVVLEFCSYRALAIENGLLFSENAIIDIESGKEIGRFPFLVSDIVWVDDGIYLFGVEPITAKISSDAEGIYAYGAAEPTDLSFSQHESSNGFRQTLFIDGEHQAVSAVAGALNVFAIFKDKYSVYSFALDGLTENSPVNLRFEPEKLYLSGGYLTVSFKNVPYTYVAPEDNASAGVYIKLPLKCDSACTVNGTLYAVSGGRLFYCNVDGSQEPVMSVRARAVATDGTRIYVLNGTSLSAYTPNLDLLARTETNGRELFVGNGVIVGGILYDTALFAEYATITAPIDYVYGNVYFSGNSIFEILTSRFIGNLGVESPDAICASESKIVIAFGGTDVTVSKYADAHDISSPPVIEGIADGGIYVGSATVTFTEGIGHVDGKVIESGAVITDAGTHTFTLTLPFGQCVSFGFTIEAKLESIEFLVPNRTMSVGETITLRVRFLPNGASSVPVTYFCDSDGLLIGEMGEVTALRTGVYTVTATVVSDSGTFVAENTITVRDDLISFKPDSKITIDRDNAVLYGIAPGSDVKDVLALLSTKKEAQFLDTEKHEVEGTVATGHTLVIFDEHGEMTDSLTVIIRGDTDGDGFITAYDMFTLERMLKNYKYEIFYLAAGDMNGNGVLADNDFRALRNIVLRRTEDILGTPDENLFGSVGIQTPTHVESGSIIDVALCLNGSKYARGINGVIEYGEGLEFIDSVTTGWDGDCRDIGDNRLGFFAYDHRGEECQKAFFVIISLRFRVTARSGDAIRISSESLTAAFASGAKLIRFDEREIKVGEKRTGDFRIDILNARSFEFDPEIYDYDGITVPYDSALADIAITHGEGDEVTVSEQVVPNGGTATVTVNLLTASGESKVYTLKVRRENEPRFDSNCRLDSLEIEGFKLLPAFDPEITEYSISVPFGTEKISVHCKAQNPTAHIIVGDTVLHSQTSAVSVTVIAPDGESLVYKIHVTVLPKVEEPSLPPSEPTEPIEEDYSVLVITLSAIAVAAALTAITVVIKRKTSK